MGSAAPTIRSLVALAEQGWASPPSQPGGAGVPEGSPFAVVNSYVRRRRRRPCLGGLPACDPETGAGLLAAVAEPASARLRVAEPVRAAASAMNSGGAVARRGQFDVSTCLACKLCGRRMNGDMTLYMYMDKGFCKPECRYEYYLEELYEQRRKVAAKARASKRDRRRHGEALRHTEGGEGYRSFRRIFFVSDTDDDDSSAKLGGLCDVDRRSC